MQIATWSSLGVIINIIMYIIMMLLIMPYFAKPEIDIKGRNIVIFTIFLAFCIFPLYSPDTFAYYVYYLSIKQGDTFGIPIEQIYFDIISAIDSFVLFRVIIWGSACFCVWYGLKFLKIKIGSFFLFFIGLYILKYSYARVFLTFALIFLGLALYYKEPKGLLHKILGLCVIISAIFFHKSALFGVAIALLTILMPSFNKGFIKFILFLYPILIISAKIIISNFFEMEFNETDLAQNTALHYLSADTREIGVGKMIENILTRYSFYVAAYIFIKMVFAGTLKKLPLKIQKIASAGFLSILIASIFMFDLEYNTQVYYYRLLHFSIIPVSIFLGYLYQIKYKLKLLRTTWKIGFIGCIYTFLYTLYNAILS